MNQSTYLNQSTLEHTLHPYHITQDIQKYLLDKYANEVDSLTVALREYISQSYWDSKNERLQSINKDLTKVILNILTQTVLIASDYVPLLAVCSSVSFGLSKYHDIQTAADVLWLINQTDLILIDIVNDTRYIKSNMQVTDLVNRLTLMCVLPPMISKPRTLRHNKSCGYLTIPTDNLILGDRDNYHDECISLDVLNTLNSQAYQLDLDICYKFQKEFKSEFDKDTDEYLNQLKTYERAKEQFEYFRDVIQDKTIHFTHKVDKRGRVYTQGYQMNYQGSSYEKACINLKTKEFVTGEL